MIRLVVLTLAAFGLFSTLVFAQEFEEIDLPKYWRGGAFINQFNNKLMQCLGGTRYDDGLIFSISHAPDKNWTIVLSRQGWQGDGESDVDVRYRFNKNRWIKASGRSVSPEALILVTSDDSDFMVNFRRRSVLEVEVYGKRIPLNLAGTTKLTDALRQCVASRIPEDYDPEGNLAEDAHASGTGIIVSPDGYILTNNHVIEECKAVHIMRNGHEPATATVVQTDAENDMALLKVDTIFAPHEVAVFRAGNALKYGESISVFGFPLAGALSTGGNFVLGNVTALSGLSDDDKYVQISAPVQPGNSGGPLLDSSGLLVGVVTMRISDIAVMRATGAVPQNINFALKRGIAINFLELNEIDYEWATPEDPLDPTEIADKSVQFSVQIACNIGNPYKDLAQLQ